MPIYQEYLVPSTYCAKASSLEQCTKASELGMHADDGSNVCLVTTEGVFHIRNSNASTQVCDFLNQVW